jgi:hypothetical protein
MRYVVWAFVAALAIFLSHAAPGHGRPAQQAYCPKEPGLLQGPYVPNEIVARQIFHAVAAVFNRTDTEGKYVVRVNEYSDAWAVYQSLPESNDACINDPTGNTKCTVTSGGGGLAMRINKCNGAISNVHYSR